MSDGEAALTDLVRGKTAAGAPFDLASQADIIDLRDQLLAALDDIRLAIINEVDALQAALLAALADVEAAIAAADAANVAAIQDARDQLLAAITALQTANNTSGDDIVAAVQAAQAALEAALASVESEVALQGSDIIAQLQATTTTLDATLDNIETLLQAEHDETQAALTQIALGQESVFDAGNSTTGAAIAAYGGVPFEPVVGSAVPAAPADTFLGVAFDVGDRNLGGFGIDSSTDSPLGEGYAIWLDENDIVTAWDTTLFAGAGRFYDPRHGGRKLIVAFQNRDASPATFRSRVVWHRGPPASFQFPIGAPINRSFPAVLVKNLSTGEQADGDFETARFPSSIAEFSTQTPLGIGGVFAPVYPAAPEREQPGPGFDTTGLASIVIAVKSDQPSATDGLLVEFSNDGFVTVNQSFPFTYDASMVGRGRRFTVPINLGEQVRISYTNGGVAQTLFDLRTEVSPTAIQPMTDDKGRGTTLTSPGLRISQVLGRAHREVLGVALSADALLFTVPAGKVFWVTSVHMVGENTSTANSMIAVLRDGGVGGTIKMPMAIEEATGGLGGINTVFNEHPALPEPIDFRTNVFFDILQGVPANIYLVLIGYLEDT